MAYSFATGGSGWTMVPCMVTFLSEVEQCVKDGLLDVTNLGQIGDARHQAEPTSRHNPARAPSGAWYVCAADFGGPDHAKLALFHQSRYKAGDPRVAPHGFSQRGDGYGLAWPSGDWYWTGRDQGHCHFDVNMLNGSLGRNWWVDSLASTAPWGLADWLRTGHTTSGGNATPIEGDDSMSAADVKELKEFIDGRLAAARTLDRADAIEQGNKVIAPVVADLEAATNALQTARADLGVLYNKLINAGIIPRG